MSTQQTSTSKSNNTSAVTLALIVVFSVVGVLAIIVIIIFLVSRARKRSRLAPEIVGHLRQKQNFAMNANPLYALHTKSNVGASSKQYVPPPSAFINRSHAAGSSSDGVVFGRVNSKYRDTTPEYAVPGSTKAVEVDDASSQQHEYEYAAPTGANATTSDYASALRSPRGNNGSLAGSRHGVKGGAYLTDTSDQSHEYEYAAAVSKQGSNDYTALTTGTEHEYAAPMMAHVS